VGIKVFDLAGQTVMRATWKHYYSSIDGIIFVLDCTDTERIQETRDELLNLLANEEAKDIPVLVFANKQDKPKAIKGTEAIELLGIGGYVNKKPVSIVRVQESSATEDQGLLEGFEWLVDKIVTMGAARQAA
jgi:small GTP-binding protein